MLTAGSVVVGSGTKRPGVPRTTAETAASVMMAIAISRIQKSLPPIYGNRMNPRSMRRVSAHADTSLTDLYQFSNGSRVPSEEPDL
jgi:hypothetical protein